MSARQDLLKLANGFRVSQALQVAAVLRVSDHLAAGPRDVTWLAERTDCHAPSLYRLLRALATVGLYEELPDRVFRSTAVGELLRSDLPQSMAPWVEYLANPSHRAAWGRCSAASRLARTRLLPSSARASGSTGRRVRRRARCSTQP